MKCWGWSCRHGAAGTEATVGELGSAGKPKEGPAPAPGLTPTPPQALTVPPTPLAPRAQLVERANEWAQRLGCGSEVHYVFTNATVSFEALLSTYPGQLDT